MNMLRYKTSLLSLQVQLLETLSMNLCKFYDSFDNDSYAAEVYGITILSETILYVVGISLYYVCCD